jgi:hypothetical protein
MIELTEILERSTAAIERKYFRIEIDGGNPKYRERVYCYELYHQMRCRWPKGSQYCLNGELDKASHPILKYLSTAQPKPDLLVHKPGDMNFNYAIIEIKKVGTQMRGIKKDLKTLDLFLREYGYQRAIYLFYGDWANDLLVKKIQKVLCDLENIPSVELWFHQNVGQPAIKILTLQK